MIDNAKPIRIMATVALALQIIATALNLLMRLFPEPLLALTASPVELLDKADIVRHPLLMLMPVLRLILVAVIFYLLIQQCNQPTPFASALAILLLIAPGFLYLLSLGANWIQTFIIHKVYDTATLASVSTFNAMSSWLSILTAPVIPLLAAAAAYNWCRQRNSLS